MNWNGCYLDLLKDLNSYKVAKTENRCRKRGFLMGFQPIYIRFGVSSTGRWRSLMSQHLGKRLFNLHKAPFIDAS